MSSDFSQFQGWAPTDPVPGSRAPVPGSGPYPPAYAPPQYGPQDTPPPGYQPAPAAAGPDPWSALQAAMARIEQLEKQVTQQGQGVGADVPRLLGPTHDLYLADGTHIENTGAVPTHVHLDDDRIMPVAYAVPR
jgi:hypothetical protein